MVEPFRADIYKQAADALGIEIEIVDEGNTYTSDNVLVQRGHKGVSIYTTRQANSRKFWNKVREIQGIKDC